MKLFHVICILTLLGNVADTQTMSVAAQVETQTQADIRTRINRAFNGVLTSIQTDKRSRAALYGAAGLVTGVFIGMPFKSLPWVVTAGVIVGIVDFDPLAPIADEFGTLSLIYAIMIRNDKQLDDLLKNNNTNLRRVSPNRTPYSSMSKYPHMQGSAPLLWAATANRIYACQVLLNYKPYKGESPVNVNATTPDGQTALHIAVSNWLELTAMTDRNQVDGHPQLVEDQQTAKDLIELFIKHKADTTLKDNYGLTISDYIQKREDVSDMRKNEITFFMSSV